MQLQLNARAKPFVPTVKANKLLQHPTDAGRESRTLLASPQIQARLGRNWRTSTCTKLDNENKVLARKKRRRGRAGRRAARRQASNDRDRARRKELIIATHSVRTMAVDGKHCVGRAAEVPGVYQEMGCNIIGLQETRRSGQSALLQAGYHDYCSGRVRRRRGLGKLFARVISRAEARLPEFISDRLLKVTLELCGQARAVTFVVGYAPTDTRSVGKSTLSIQPWKGSSRKCRGTNSCLS